MRVRWWDGGGGCGEMGVAPVALAEVGGSRDVRMSAPHLQKKKSGGSIQLPWRPPFYLYTSPTKSNPDIRNSKLAHIQAGF